MDEYITHREAFGADMILGAKVKVHRTAIIQPHVIFVEAKGVADPIVIERDCLVRTGAVIYSGCHLRANVSIGHNSVVRENTEIGQHTYIGGLVDIEGNTEIGHHCGFQANCHLTAHMKIGNYVFFGPMVCTGNERQIRYRRKGHGKHLKGPTIENDVRVGEGAKLLPGIVIGTGAVVAAGAVVVKDVDSYSMVMGVPAKRYRALSPSGKVSPEDRVIRCKDCEVI